VHFIAILDFGDASDLASEMDGKNGEAISAAVGCVWRPWVSTGPNGARDFR
jgi:hypothetical protein